MASSGSIAESRQCRRPVLWESAAQQGNEANHESLDGDFQPGFVRRHRRLPALQQAPQSSLSAAGCWCTAAPRRHRRSAPGRVPVCRDIPGCSGCPGCTGTGGCAARGSVSSSAAEYLARLLRSAHRSPEPLGTRRVIAGRPAIRPRAGPQRIPVSPRPRNGTGLVQPSNLMFLAWAGPSSLHPAMACPPGPVNFFLPTAHCPLPAGWLQYARS